MEETKVMENQVEEMQEQAEATPTDVQVVEPKTPAKVKVARWISKHRTLVVGATTTLIGMIGGAILGGAVVHNNHKDDWNEGFEAGVNSIEVTPDDVPEVDIPTDNVEV